MVFPHVFFSSPVASLSSFLGSSCDVGVPCLPSSSLLSGVFWWLCLSYVCSAPSFSCPGFTVLSLVLPLSLLVVDLSFCLLALLFVLFLGLSSLFLAVFYDTALSSSSALSSSFVPERRGLLVCLQFHSSSMVVHTASLSSVVAAASSSSFWFSPLAIILLCCSALGVVSLGSCGAGASCRFVLLYVLIFTP